MDVLVVGGRIWKNQGEIEEFLMRLNDEMQEMGAHPKRMANGGREVYIKHKKLTDSHLMDADRIREFEELLNLLAMQPFLSKCEDFLLFIEHCMPTDKCTPLLTQGTSKSTTKFL